MYRNINEIIGYTLDANDGEIGRVTDFLFDDHDWVIRYLVADTAKWLPGRQILIAPEAINGEPSWDNRTVPIDLTKQQIEDSPSIADDKPVSRQKEIELTAYFSWRTYWAMVTHTNGGDPNLRSMKEVMGYRINTLDDRIGQVDDFIIDTDQWLVRFLVVDTRKWLPGKKVLIIPSLAKVVWADQDVHVMLTAEQVRNCSEFDPNEPINSQKEVHLYNFEGRQLS